MGLIGSFELIPRYNMYYLHISKNATKPSDWSARFQIKNLLGAFTTKNNMANVYKNKSKKSTRTGHTFKKEIVRFGLN